MKLRNKVLLILGLGLVGISASFYAVSRSLIGGSFDVLEKQHVQQNVERSVDAVLKDLDAISRVTLDYSQWDDSYEFIVSGDKKYIESNFTAIYDDLKFNAVIFVDSAAKVVTALGADIDLKKEVPVSKALLDQLTPDSFLLNHPDAKSLHQGILQLPEGPMLIVSRPIVPSSGAGPIRGTVIMGRYLNPSYIQQLETLTKLPDLTVEKFDSTQASADFQAARQALANGEKLFIKPLSETSIAGFSLLKDISGKPALLLRSTESRDIYSQGQASIRYLLLASLLTGLVFSGTTLLFLERSILSRLTRLSAGVSRMGTQGFTAEKVTLDGTDELSDLSRTFNTVFGQLEESQSQLQKNAERLQKQNSVLADLSQSDLLVQGNFEQAVKLFVKAISDTLNIDRVSIWLFNSDRSQLTCSGLYELASGQFSDGTILHTKDFPNYMETLVYGEPVVADDAETNPHTKELKDIYLKPHQIKSLLDSPIQIAGRRIGVIRCEQVGAQRQWQPEEQTFIYSIANLVALALENETLQSEVGHLLEIVSQAGEGNLMVQAEVSDRLTGLVSDIFNRLIEQLAQVLNQVLETAHQISQATSQQKALVETVATNARQQDQEVAQVLQLTKQVEQVAQRSAKEVESSNESLRLTSVTLAEGRQSVDALTQGIGVLQEGTDQIMQRMKTLGEFVGLTDQFVQDQNQIAFVTQTLALNASLVAARASEQRDPRQFVVVAREFDSIADQVSKLAQQTSEGLITIEQRSAQIHSVVSAVDTDVQSLGELVRRFTQGVEQSSQVFKQVQTVIEAAMQVGETVTESSQRIVTATQTTAESVRDIAGLATKTTDLALLTRQQSDQVDTLSNQLLQSIQFFQLPHVIQSNQKVEPENGYDLEGITLTIAAEEASPNIAS